MKNFPIDRNKKSLVSVFDNSKINTLSGFQKSRDELISWKQNCVIWRD